MALQTTRIQSKNDPATGTEVAFVDIVWDDVTGAVSTIRGVNNWDRNVYVNATVTANKTKAFEQTLTPGTDTGNRNVSGAGLLYADRGRPPTNFTVTLA